MGKDVKISMNDAFISVNALPQAYSEYRKSESWVIVTVVHRFSPTVLRQNLWQTEAAWVACSLIQTGRLDKLKQKFSFNPDHDSCFCVWRASC